ncbi:MAG: DUF1080 domain-containing protein [Planctomycetes bacterium]|jgi:tetratricopeptide (TPR) repeat protein|nr:DUF1080 domain-containing protein [Planctomycetota bacterium]
MTGVRGLAPILAFALLALGPAASARADRETAEFQAGRADKALAGKKWAEAEDLYRKAIDEDPAYLPARHGLAQALLGAGRSASAIEELRAFVEAARALAPLPPEWKSTFAAAEKQLAGLDAAGSALAKIRDQYVSDLVGLAERWLAKDPELAERALRQALRLTPGHARAEQLLGKLGKSASHETVKLFDGKSLAGWQFANAPTWQVIDGELVGNVRDACMNIRSDRMFSGNFDVRIEVRIVETFAGPPMFALLPCWTGDYDHYSFGSLNGRVRWWDVTAEGVSREIVSMAPADFRKPFDPSVFNLFEYRFRAAEVETLLNGETVGREPRPENRKSGFIGLQVQNSRVAFREVSVDQR